MKLLTPQAVKDAFPRTVFVEVDANLLADMMERGWYQPLFRFEGEPLQYQWLRVTAVVPQPDKDAVTLEVTSTAPREK